MIRTVNLYKEDMVVDKMDWFTCIPTIFLVSLAIISLFGFLFYWNSLDFKNPDKANENMEKTTGFIEKNAIPEEFSFIAWSANKLSNHPFILLTVILCVLWLFGYFLPKGH